MLRDATLDHISSGMSSNEVPLSAAEIRAELMKTGRVKSHVDTMIAGIALAGGHVLVTRDADFNAIGDSLGLEIDVY